MRIALLACIALVCLSGLGSTAAAERCGDDPATRLTPCDLEVVGGSETWRRDEVFGLQWRNPQQGSEPPIVAVHYRVLDGAMRPVAAEKAIGATDSTELVLLSPVPGIYTVEVWLEDAAGDLGAPATASLRFDNARPAPTHFLPSPGWIGRPAFPYPMRVGMGAGTPPLSGIRGYAVVVDGNPDGEPCASSEHCTVAETVLHSGIEEDTLWLQSLPEGTSYAHAVAVSGSGVRTASSTRTALRVDTTEPTTTLHGVPHGWSNRPVSLTATAIDTASGMSTAGPATPFAAIRVDGGTPTLAAGDTARAVVIAPGVHSVAYYAGDAAGNIDDGHGDNPPPASTTVRIDLAPPSVAFSSAQDPRDPEKIEARVLDPLSGPSPSLGSIAVRRTGSGERFKPLPTTVAEGDLRAYWDSSAFPPGRYEFQASGFDRAGNESTTTSRANGSRMVLSAPLKAPTQLHLELGPRGPSNPIPLGEESAVTGRLIGGRRSGLAGMPVRVIERFAPGAARRERRTTLRTAGDGTFRLQLPPGPSREVVATFAGTPTLSGTQSRAAALDVQGRLWMRSSASTATVGGRPVLFRGRIAGEIPPAGKYVQLQFRLPGGRWSEFRSVRSDAGGRFRYRYRFSDDDSRGVRFEFRAYASAEDDWPYEPSGSRPVVVRGR